MQTMFKVGDRVKSVSQGEGVISEININNAYPVHVEFDNGNYNVTFRFDGHFDKQEIETNRIHLVEQQIQKQYNRLEMINMFYADNELEFMQIINSGGGKSECTINKNNISSKYPWCENDKSVFILKPSRQLKKMSFGLALKKCINILQMRSVLTGNIYNNFSNHTDEELEDYWTVDGIYEA